MTRPITFIALTILVLSCASDSSNNEVDCETDKTCVPNRTEATACNQTRVPVVPESGQTVPGPGDECLVHADCTDGPNGRCVADESGATGCRYDECFTDSDCPGMAVCACGETEPYYHIWNAWNSSVNRCIDVECRTDADCDTGLCLGKRGYCGVTSVGVHTYHCATEQDECLADSQCAPEENGNENWCNFGRVDGQPAWSCGHSGATCE